MSPVIELDGVNFSYRGPRVLAGVSLEVERGEFLGIVGPNGSGKSTLIKLILGLLRPDSGTVRVLGGDPEDVRARLGYVPQFALFRRDFPLSVEHMVLQGRLGGGLQWGPWRRADRQAARQALEEMNIAELAPRPIATLSGGQLQRAVIARALVSGPEILLLDEPTSNVDVRQETALFEHLKALTERCTVLVVSHDVGFISGYVDRVACVNRSVVTHRTAELTGETIESLYGEPLRMVHGHGHHHGSAPR